MKHLKEFTKIFETLYTPEIHDYIDDIFFEFSDYYKYEVTINTDEMIHTAPNTSSVIFGNNFIYPSNSEKQYGRLPGMGNRNWKLGFLVTISCTNAEYNSDLETLRFGYNIGRNAGRIVRRDKVKSKRDYISYKKRVDKYMDDIKSLVLGKIKMIKRRCPKEIFLHGVKMIEESGGRIVFEFAFIYQEFK